MEPLNDAESTIAVEELMTPIVEMLVVRTENLETDEVKEEMDFFKSVEKIGVKGDFQFFFLTDYADGSTTSPQKQRNLPRIGKLSAGIARKY